MIASWLLIARLNCSYTPLGALEFAMSNALMGQLITVSVETVRLVSELAAFSIDKV
jgi:hypothetical protein